MSPLLVFQHAHPNVVQTKIHMGRMSDVCFFSLADVSRYLPVCMRLKDAKRQIEVQSEIKRKVNARRPKSHAAEQKLGAGLTSS